MPSLIFPSLQEPDHSVATPTLRPANGQQRPQCLQKSGSDGSSRCPSIMTPSDSSEHSSASSDPPLDGVEGESMEDKLEPIAIVGLACRFPQEATSPETFWQMMLEARSGMTDVPKDRFNIDAFYEAKTNRPGMMNVKGGHFIREDLAGFDAGFFSITPSEASSMDPQQRWLLESAYEALENAGIPMERAVGSDTSVYVGSFLRDYEQMTAKEPELENLYKATGTGTAMLANRLSWFYDFSGPSIALDTACSSSLTALHLACQSLRSRESSMALVCGCNLIFRPETTASLTDLHFLSPDSKCYSFDHRANGYSRGEGFGVVVLKPLTEAISDGDTIRAVIRATGVNQDGRTPGITQPSSQAQEAMIRRTYDDGGLSMATTRFFEAHGTGTALGDPIEAKAIYRAFEEHRSQSEPLYVGAVKSNIGHLEGASGIAGLIKSILSLEKGIIPPNTLFERPNPMIQMDEWNLAFPLKPEPWPTAGLRRASVSSFGFGGANAHAVLDDAYNYQRIRHLRGRHNTRSLPPTHDILDPTSIDVHSDHSVDQATRPRLLVWSASDEDGLRRWESEYREYFATLRTGDVDKLFNDLAHTLYQKRSLLPLRSYTVVTSAKELASGVQLSQPVRATKSPKLAFVFTGQGAQWRDMGRELLECSAYRESLEAAERYFYGLGCQWSLLEELYRDDDGDSNLDDPMYSQPACTALQIALVDLLSSWGAVPSAVLGHSSGEIAAAYCAGGLSRDSAWKVAYYRGLATASIRSNGSEATTMMSVGLSAEDVQPYLDQITDSEEVSVGCINSPHNVTLSGSQVKIEALQELFKTEGIFCQKLKVNIAYHTKYMENCSFIYRSLIGNIQGRDLCHQPVMFSSVTGQQIDVASLAQPDYWVQNMVSPVRFSEAVSRICGKPSKQIKSRKSARDEAVVVDYALELGPHCTLQGPLKEIFDQHQRGKSIGYSSLLRRRQPAMSSVLDAVGKLHCMGYQLDLSKVNVRGEDRDPPQMLTGLPSYPFNHAKKYWLESRQSKSYRFRQFPHHELLGTCDSDWNPLLAKWHNRISSSDQAFVKDHRVNGVEAYPAAGMLVMAIEAIKQLNSGEKCTGYRLKDVLFHRALVVPSSPEGVEVHLLVGPASSVEKKSSWTQFKLYAYESEQWDEICRGAVLIEIGETEASAGTKEDVHDKERQLELQAYRNTFEDGLRKCKMAMTSKRLYETFAQQGLQYGPSFQNLKSIYFDDDGHAVGTIDPRDWKVKIQQGEIQPHAIHPTTLDSILQLAFPALTEGGKRMIPTMVPTKISKFWMSDSVRDLPSTQNIRVLAQGKFAGFRSAEVSIIAVGRDHEPCMVADFEMTFIAGDESLASNQMDRFQRFYNVVWKPDPELLESTQVEAFSTSSSAPTPVDQILNDEKEAACLLVMRALVREIGSEDLAEPPHIRKYHEWMKHRCRTHSAIDPDLDAGTLNGKAEEGDELERLLELLDNHDVEGKLIVRVARNLKHVLTGKLDALELLFGDSLLQEYYRDAHDAPYVLNRVKTCVDAMAHQNPGMKILEIGAGTGSATVSIMDALGSNDRFSEYAFTDISPSFFEKAQEQFDNENMVFKTLDIEKDPLEQGFDPGHYDLVVAANVLHATTKLDDTLQNTKKLIKPGGKLIMFEGVNPARVRISFIFGLLAGWWLSTEEHRRWGPMMYRERWHEHLVRTGFSGVDMVLSNYEDLRYQLCSALVSSVPYTQEISMDQQIAVIVRDESSPIQSTVARLVESYLRSQDYTQCQSISPNDLGTFRMDRAYYLFLSELERPFLDSVDQESLAALQQLCSTARGLLWLTHVEPRAQVDPRAGATVGLSRCIAQEHEGVRSVTLNVQTLQADDVAALVIKVVRAALFNQSAGYEPEYAEINGRLCINRVMPADEITGHVSERTKAKPLESRPIGQAVAAPLSMTIGSVGLLDSLHFKEDPLGSQPLPDHEIEIRTKAVGVNFRDVLVALGQVSADYFGNECSGIVTRVGSSAASKFKVGDRVVCALSAAFRTVNRCAASVASHVPDDMDYATAAAIPIAFCTAEYCLSHWARLKAGESILIHSAAGGFGQAVVQLAKLRGAEIFITVGTEEKRKLMTDVYGIPEDHIFSSRSLSFAKGVQRMTNGRGVDVVINSLAGEGLRSSWECIAPFGRFIEVGKKDIYAGTNSNLGGLPMYPFSKNVMFASVDLALIIDVNPTLLSDLMGHVMTLAESKQISAPQPLRGFKASEIEAAFRYMQSGKQSGKLVVHFDDEDVITMIPSSNPTYNFDPHATYLIAGGLGGLGRSLSRWMASRGVKHLILLSRSTVYNEETRIFLQELKDRGVDVATPPCDISDTSRLKEVLESCSSSMPPIKGCIQASMVLQNAMFKNMSLGSLDTVLRPKVQGSWNLHQLLPKGMDFFVLLSSYAGIIGAVGQSNYACGNTYQDALARHRVAHGEKAVALDLGVIESVGMVSEHDDVAGYLRSTGHEGLAETELHALLEYYCDPGLPVQPELGSQVITSLELPSTLHAKNLVDLPWMSMPIFRQLWRIQTTFSHKELGGMEDASDYAVDLEHRLAMGGSMEELSEIVCELVRMKVSRMLAIELSGVDVGKPLHTYGVDSLVAIELRNWFAKAVGADVAVFEILGNASMATLAGLAAEKSKFASKESRKVAEGDKSQ